MKYEPMVSDFIRLWESWMVLNSILVYVSCDGELSGFACKSFEWFYLLFEFLFIYLLFIFLVLLFEFMLFMWIVISRRMIIINKGWPRVKKWYLKKKGVELIKNLLFWRQKNRIKRILKWI